MSAMPAMSGVLDRFEREVFGPIPPAVSPQAIERSTSVAADGGYRLLQVRASSLGAVWDVATFVPASKPVRAVLLGLNFFGNQALDDERSIWLPRGWVSSNVAGVIDHRATEASRGFDMKRHALPIRKLVELGVAVVSVYGGDTWADRPPGEAIDVPTIAYAGARSGAEGGVQRGEKRGVDEHKDRCGAIAVWAWTLNRTLDLLREDAVLHDVIGEADVWVWGHSRLGKAALLAGAVDGRYAGVVSNQSGACGAGALKHPPIGAERMTDIARFRHWFCPRFYEYSGQPPGYDRELDLPVDMPEMLRLIAPQRLLICSAEADTWAGPQREYRSVREIADAWGLSASDFPIEAPRGKIVGDRIGYYLRTGGHGVIESDFDAFLSFMRVGA